MRRALVLTLLLAWSAAGQPVEPVYVGARVCAECHAGPGMGYQFSLWLNSKHSRAYATLALPEAKKIAELSGIREDPQESFTCLGCHSSGAQAEEWQKDDTFRIAEEASMPGAAVRSARVSVPRVDPEVWVAPDPGGAVERSTGEARDKG